MSASEHVYGDSYISHKFEQYKLFVEMADRISQRRMNTNTFFITLNSLLITIFGIFSKEFLKERWIIPCIGITVSIAWFLIIKSYSTLNSAKFKVINKIEEDLPVELYSEEWKILEANKNYKTLTNIENIVPIVFFVLFITLLLLHIPKETVLLFVNSIYQ